MSALDHQNDRLIAPPFRVDDKGLTSWDLCIQYIRTHHSSNNTSAMEAAIKDLATKRSIITSTCTPNAKFPPSDSFIKETLIPYCQHVAMAQAHFPLAGGKINNLKFFWRDSFDSSTKYESQNSNLELLSCIYNLAASYAHVAVRAAQSSVLSDIKRAFADFQNAAGYYAMLSSLSPRVSPEELRKGDMNPEMLRMLQSFCMAQAHHCAYLKAESDMKDNHAVLSKIAKQGALLYEEIMRLQKISTWYSKTPTGKDVASRLEATKQVMHARASLHLAVQCEKDGDMGAAIGYLEQAQAHLAKVPKVSNADFSAWCTGITKNVKSAYEKMVQTNNTVYYARVRKDLDQPEGLPRALGKPTEHPSFLVFESKRGFDPFFGIIPSHIANEVAHWRDAQRKRVQQCLKVAESCRTAMDERFQVLRVAATVQVMSGEAQSRGRIPEPLRTRIVELRTGEDGEQVNVTAKLMHWVKTHDELHQVALSKIAAVEHVLAAEVAADEEKARAYGDKMWRAVCPPSNETPDYISLTAAVQEHKKGLQKWLVESFNKAKTLMKENLQDLARFDWPMADLDALMPFQESKESRELNDNLQQFAVMLKKLLNDKESVTAEYGQKEKELRTLLESDSVVFQVAAVTHDKRAEVLQTAEMELTDAMAKVTATTKTMQTLSDSAEEGMASMGVMQSTNPITAEIQNACNGLESACAVYTNLEKEFTAIRCYCASAIDAVESTLSTAKSFAMSRALQAEEFQNRLDTEIARRMQAMEQGHSAIVDSRQRQEELQRQIAALESGQMGAHPMPGVPTGGIIGAANAMLPGFGTPPPPPSYDAAMNPPGYYPPPPTQHGMLPGQSGYSPPPPFPPNCPPPTGHASPNSWGSYPPSYQPPPL